MIELILLYLKELRDRFDYDGCNDLSPEEQEIVKKLNAQYDYGEGLELIHDNMTLVIWLMNQLENKEDVVKLINAFESEVESFGYCNWDSDAQLNQYSNGKNLIKIKHESMAKINTLRGKILKELIN